MKSHHDHHSVAAVVALVADARLIARADARLPQRFVEGDAVRAHVACRIGSRSDRVLAARVVVRVVIDEPTTLRQAELAVEARVEDERVPSRIDHG